MQDAYRKGIITSEDILSRVDDLAVAKKKAEIQLAQETISPGQIQARQSAADASTAQSQYNAATARAGMPNITPAAQNQSLQLARQKAEATYGADNIAAYTSYAPMYGLPSALLKDGMPDYDAQGIIGSKIRSDYLARQFAASAIIGKPQSPQVVGGVQYTRYLNAHNEDVTPPSASDPNGSPMWQHYNKVLTTPASLGDISHLVPGAISTAPVTSGGTVPTVSGSSGFPGAPSAVPSGFPGTSTSTDLVAPRTPPSTLADISPGSPATPLVSGNGMVTGVEPGYFLRPQEIDDQRLKLREEARKAPALSDWGDKISAIRELREVSSAVPQMKPDAAFNTLDFQLLQSVRKLAVQAKNAASSSRGTPDLATKNLEESMPWMNRIDSLDTMLKTAKREELVPEKTREMLIDLGNRYASGMEKAAAAELVGIDKLAKPVGGLTALYGPDTAEMQLFNRRNELLQPAASAATPAAPMGQEHVLPSGIKLYRIK